VSDYYSTKAEEMRALAEKASNKKTRDEFLKLAQEYDALSLSQIHLSADPAAKRA
jgi:hypothetical protein